MFLTVHAAGGIIISQAVKEPWLIFTLSFLSHYLLDFIPHGDEGIGRWLEVKNRRLFLIGTADMLVMVIYFIFVLIFIPDINLSLMMLGAFGAILPDFLSQLHHQTSNYLAPLHNPLKFFNRFRLTRYFLKRHDQIHRALHWAIEKNMPWRLGLVFQISIVLIFFGLVSLI